MKARFLVVVPALLLMSAVCVQAQTAHANIVDSTGKSVGKATLKQTSGGVEIKASLANLPAGTHGMHIHAVGKCDAPDFKTAGGHFNPDMKKHGMDNPDGMHAGDLPNIEVGADGKAKVKVVDAHVTLKDGDHSLFHDGGTSIVIHAGADDYKTDPSGNSGNRIACGVIEK
ncbi:MAG TPA: superoxide dismutase family protein [Candidatus Baltobacteraceae bacterium]|nr:superoxide dismutase family protein [Candidatus Baltobacteraceae bacterium]